MASAESLDARNFRRRRRRTTWKRRYREINDWERYLTDNGFRIVKVREPARRGSPRSPSVERWSSR
jgi:hypothetical protein